MRRADRSINIFSISFLDVISGALGAFLIIMLVLLQDYEPRLREVTEQQRDSIETLLTTMDEMVDSINTVTSQLAEAQTQIQNALGQAAAVRQQLANLGAQTEEIERLRQALDAAQSQLQAAQRQTANMEQRLGLALQEEQIVFVIDVSGSMNLGCDTCENKLAQVAFGIKLLVASMNDDYLIDIVYFPNEVAGTSYGAMWGELRQVTESRKPQIYAFLASLRALGGTPTADVLDAVVGGSVYATTETVILLSDGQPCTLASGSCSPLTTSELEALVARTTATNAGRMTISTIGVGTEFRNPSGSDPTVTFLRSLAARNGGFYFGF